MAATVSIARRFAAWPLLFGNGLGFDTFPSQLTVTVTPLYTRVAVQVTEDSTILAGTTLEGEIDVLVNGEWRPGTSLYPTYDTSNYYANAFNLPEATDVIVRLTVRLLDSSGNVVRKYINHYSTTTKDSTPPVDGTRFAIYVDCQNGSNSNDGLTPGNPKLNFDGSGTQSVSDLAQLHQGEGVDVYVMNGDLRSTTTGDHRITGLKGAATNWARILPYGTGKITNEIALNGTWTDESAEATGLWSMDCSALIFASSASTGLGMVYDATAGAMLYPFARWENSGTDYGIKSNTFRSGDTTGFWVKYHTLTISSTANNGGKVQFNFSAAHSPAGYPALAVGDKILVSGHAVGAYNVAHTIASLDDSDTVTTNINYTSGTGGATARINKLFVRIAGGGSPGSGRLKGGYLFGLFLNDCQYVVVEDMTFEFCGSMNKQVPTTAQTASSGGYGFGVNGISSTSCSDIIVRNPTFNYCGPCLQLADGTGSCDDVLVDGGTCNRPGAWDRIFEQFDFDEADPYTQTNSWDGFKGSAWEIHAISITGGSGFVLRDMTVTGYEFISATGSDSTRAKHLHVHGITLTGGMDDALGDVEDNAAINAAFHHNSVTDAATVFSMTPYDAGPCWVFANVGDGILHTPYKFGDHAGDATTGNAFRIVANNSTKMRGVSSDKREGHQHSQLGHSGLLYVNNVTHGFQSTASGDDWAVDMEDGALETLLDLTRINRFENSYEYIENLSTPAEPKIRWGSVTYDDFADAHAALAATYVEFVDMQKRWEANGDAAPFPTTAAAGLNASITTKSVSVRGVTCLASDNPDDLRIGAFTLRDAG